jgi:hypothetical protein
VVVQVYENEGFDLTDPDLGYLKARLRGHVERRADGWAITRNVGHVALPSGRHLQIRSRKATDAAVLAWIAYTDPALASLRLLGDVPDATGAGDVGALAARLFVREMLEVLGQRGLLKRYQQLRVRTATVRGAIDFARLSRTGGELSRMPCVVWERRRQTRLNRLLAAVIECIWRDRLLRDACRCELPTLRGLYADVRAESDPALRDGRVELQRDETPFEVALALGRLVLHGVELGEGDESSGPSYLVNVERLFERAVVRAFQRAGLAGIPQASIAYHLRVGTGPDTAASMAIDYLLTDPRHLLAVVDAKFKRTVTSDNLQQVVTYCYCTGSRRGFLILPSGPDGLTTRRYVFGRRGGREDSIALETIGFAVDSTSVAGWEARGGQMAAEVMERSRRVAGA